MKCKNCGRGEYFWRDTYEVGVVGGVTITQKLYTCILCEDALVIETREETIPLESACTGVQVDAKLRKDRQSAMVAAYQALRDAGRDMKPERSESPDALRQKYPYVCSDCGRRMRYAIEICNMTQPDGTKCRGRAIRGE